MRVGRFERIRMGKVNKWIFFPQSYCIYNQNIIANKNSSSRSNIYGEKNDKKVIPRDKYMIINDFAEFEEDIDIKEQKLKYILR